MKKLLITGFIIMFAVLFVTCDLIFPEDEISTANNTDVVYNVDDRGAINSVTLYLDGVGVPRSAAQRAITTDLAKMTYDYFEVLFIGRTAADVARASWSLGEPAGISGIDRGPATNAGVDYGYTDTKALVTAPIEIAVMFVGKKDGKTLLGVGQIGNVDNSTIIIGANGFPTTLAAAQTTIKPATKSVTFFIEAIKTGLLVGDETAGPTYSAAADNDYGILTDSFDFTSVDTLNPTGTWLRKDHSSRTTIGGVDYPMYQLPLKSNFASTTKTMATYTFKGAATKTGGTTNMLSAIRFNSAFNNNSTPADTSDDTVGMSIERRIPRYMDNGRYYQLKSNTDSSTTVELNPTYYATAIAAGGVFDPAIPLIFTTRGSGVFSFFLEIPVYMLEKATKATNSTSDLYGEVWKIRTGIGSELWNLDSGKSAGGCVLMSIGVSSLDDWLDIEWEWVK